MDSSFPSLINALVDKSLGMGKMRSAQRYALALTNWFGALEVPVDHPAALLVVDCLMALAEASTPSSWR